MVNYWQSPDNKIKKEVVVPGRFGEKPSEWSQCTVTITDCPHLGTIDHKSVIIGDNDGDMWRAIDICIMTMFKGEKSRFTVDVDSTVSFVLELHDFIFRGFIYEWDVSKKYEISVHHKERGNELFQQKNNREAGFRFTKALKIISSVPIDVEGPPDEIDGVSMDDIRKLKATLFNNLSTCYFKNHIWNMVIELCKKVFIYDKDNVKALYRIGVAYENDRNFEKAYEAFNRVLELDPENKSSAEHLANVKEQLKKAEIKANNILKKMFTGALGDVTD